MSSHVNHFQALQNAEVGETVTLEYSNAGTAETSYDLNQSSNEATRRIAHGSKKVEYNVKETAARAKMQKFAAMESDYLDYEPASTSTSTDNSSASNGTGKKSNSSNEDVVGKIMSAMDRTSSGEMPPPSSRGASARHQKKKEGKSKHSSKDHHKKGKKSKR